MAEVAGAHCTGPELLRGGHGMQNCWSAGRALGPFQGQSPAWRLQFPLCSPWGFQLWPQLYYQIPDPSPPSFFSPSSFPLSPPPFLLSLPLCPYLPLYKILLGRPSIYTYHICGWIPFLDVLIIVLLIFFLSLLISGFLVWGKVAAGWTAKTCQ